MKTIAVVAGVVGVISLILASVGFYFERNFYLEFSLSNKVAKFIRETGRWPDSWEDLEREGIYLLRNHKLRCGIAWDVDPFELYREGKIVPLSGGFKSNESMVVYYQDDLPESGEISWLLPFTISQTIASLNEKKDEEQP